MGTNKIFLIIILLTALFLRLYNLNYYKRKLFIIFLWLLLGILSLAFAKLNLVNHYFLHLFPLIFILLGNMFCSLLKNKSKKTLDMESLHIF